MSTILRGLRTSSLKEPLILKLGFKRGKHDSNVSMESKGQASISEKVNQDAPVKFTTSKANIDYRATRNFYGDDRDLPPSHNAVLSFTGIAGTIYLFLLRDDGKNDGGANLLKPLHETMPELAIPLLRTAIEENRKHGRDTSKLEQKLREYMKEPEKYGMNSRKLVEN